jgi:hypothetical protein
MDVKNSMSSWPIASRKHPSHLLLNIQGCFDHQLAIGGGVGSNRAVQSTGSFDPSIFFGPIHFQI